MKLKFSIVFALLLFSKAVSAQINIPVTTWHFIDTSLQKNRNLDNLLRLINELEEQSLSSENYFNYARCLNYKIQVRDKKTEDTLYFKNSAFIDTLLQQNNLSTKAQYALHIMAAKRLLYFVSRYKSFNQNRYERKDLLINYAALTNDEITGMAVQHFEKAKALAKQMGTAAIDDALWLSADPLQFLFKPGLFDIAIAAHINSIAFVNQYRANASDLSASWLPLSQNAFISKLDSLEDKKFTILMLYREWLTNKKTDPAAYYFVETLARKYFYLVLEPNYEESKKEYEQYLRQLLQSPYNTVKAHGVYQLCLLLNKQGNKYFPGHEYNYRLYNLSAAGVYEYDTAYRYHPAKALALFQENKQMLDSFFYLKNILQQMEGQIRDVDLQFSMQNNNLPGEPLLGELKFKNTEQLFYKIVQLEPGDNQLPYYQQTNILTLLAKPAVAQGSITLPATYDFNYHNTYVKFDALPPGSYRMLFANKNLSDSNVLIRSISFAVTNIAVINSDNRVYVLNRKTGMPLTGAKVKAGYFKEIIKDNEKTKKYVSENYLVNKSGYVIIRNVKYTNLDVHYGNDSITEKIDLPEKNDEAEEGTYSEEDYDDLVEFYDDEARAYVYTDRSIYRPGQTVYYKAIFVTKNPKTGEPMLMNKKNLKGKLFGSVYKRWLKEEEPWLIVTDPFNKEMDSLKIVPNEFGSVSGSFKLPKTAATGEWNVEPDYIEIEGQFGSFKVEEYKRPSYEINIEKPKAALRMKDKFSFKVHIKSFAGAALNNVAINYTITRSGWLPVFDPLQRKIVNKSNADEIAKSTGYTDATGILEIFVDDSLLNKYNLADSEKLTFNYELNVKAIDATGESYSENARVNISSQPVKIKWPLQNKLNRAALPQLLVTAEEENAGIVNKMIRIRFYKITANKKLYNDRKLAKADEWIYDKEALRQWFPQVNLYLDETKDQKKLVWDTIVNTGLREKMTLPISIFIAGNYTVEAVCEENGKVIGKLSKQFTVYDAIENNLPEQTWDFYNLPYNSVQAGDSIKYYYGSSAEKIYSVFHLAYYPGKQKRALNYFYEEQSDPQGLHLYKLKIPGEIVDQAKLTHIFIFNNQVFRHEERIFINNNKAVEEPEIIIEKYRKNLVPGSKETFTLSVKTKNENVAAELMTTMYDAALDKLEKHKWELPRNRSYSSISTDWPYYITNTTTGGYDFFNRKALPFSIPSPPPPAPQPLWWVNPLDYTYAPVFGSHSTNARFKMDEELAFDAFNGNVNNALAGKVAGVNISSTYGLDNVVVVGYGIMKSARSTSSSVVAIRGQSSLLSYVQSLVILDGVVYEGDLSKIDMQSITNGLVLKGAEATAIYGSRGSNGVLVLSTKGEIILPGEPEPVIIPRKNFNESAFFFPAMHADKDGFYTFSFTMPETVTEWNWKMLAHTKLAKFIYAERKLNTQLPLMVQPNMPRLLYQGDRIVLQSRISNTDTVPATGKIFCKIEDAVTGDDITDKLIATSSQVFSLNKKENKAAAFEIRVPLQQLNPIKIIVKASSGNFTDGEEHLIPVLSPKVFVRQSQSFYFKNNADTVLKTTLVNANAEVFGMAVSIDAKPQSALVNALPWLANYPYECAEQTFNKLLANMTALKLMRTDKMAQRSFTAAKTFVENDKSTASKLPDELNQETMPWLNNANQSSLSKKQLFNVLDTSRTLIAIKELVQKIYKFQRNDGGIGWFNGGQSSFYISNYLMRGFGSLNKDSLYFPEYSLDGGHKKFIEDLIAYTDKEFTGFLETRLNTPGLLYYVYARSYWQKQNPINSTLLKNIQSYLLTEWKDADKKTLYDQSLLIIASLRFAYGDQYLITKALAQLNSIRQLAISDEQNGIRWKDLADADDLNTSSEETIAMIAEAFKESGTDEAIRNGIIKWLLTAKKEDHWNSTKATAAVINLLFKNKGSVIGETQTVTAAVAEKNMTVTDDLLSGTAYDFSRVNSIPDVVKIKKQAGSAASGSLTSYYFTTDSLLNDLNKNIRLDKKMYVWNDALNNWSLVNSNTVLKIADKVKVVLTIESSRSLPFVFIDDKRAAAFEPAKNNSGYEYASGISYYKSVRDAGCHFFAENIPSGKHEIVYELKVSQEGSFTSGPAVLQCMYKPEAAAYSNGSKIVTVR